MKNAEKPLLYCDIIDDIIKERKRLRRARSKLEALKNTPSNIRPKQLKNLAKSLGRIPYPRGKGPTFINPRLPRSKPLTIPNHPGALPRYTAESILEQIEGDLFALEEKLENEAERRKRA